MAVRAKARWDHEASPARVQRVGPRPLLFHLWQLQLGAGTLPNGGSGKDAAPAAFIEGVKAYWRHPYRRETREVPVRWREGSTRLLDYGAAGDVPILILPPLINRPYILDLLPERSFLRHLTDAGFRPLLLDWGEPSGAGLQMTLADHAPGRAGRALDAILALTGARPVVLGYCMGGLLACALAAHRPELAGLVLLATPWDFHAMPMVKATAAGLLPLTLSLATLGFAPAELVQLWFVQQDPGEVRAKFARFAQEAPESARARLFVAVEDWLNDGLPMAGPVAQECLWHWLVENRPVKGGWAPGGVAVRPERLDLPTFVVVPRHDRVVPAASAEPLAQALPAAETLRPPLGHIGLVTAETAPALVWDPLTAWLRRIAPRR